MPTIDNLVIDQELRAYIPALAIDELRGLVEMIERDGRVLNPLIAWADGSRYILVDGHNRREAYQSLRKKGVEIPPPEVIVLEFADRDDVKWWMLSHQLKRRNLDKAARDRLLAALYELAKKAVGRPAKKLGQSDPISGDSEKGGQSGPLSEKPAKTAEKVAAATGVSASTVKRAVRAQRAPKPAVKKHNATFDPEKIEAKVPELDKLDGAFKGAAKKLQAAEESLGGNEHAESIAKAIQKARKSTASWRESL